MDELFLTKLLKKAQSKPSSDHKNFPQIQLKMSVFSIKLYHFFPLQFFQIIKNFMKWKIYLQSFVGENPINRKFIGWNKSFFWLNDGFGELWVARRLCSIFEGLDLLLISKKVQINEKLKLIQHIISGRSF
jgi:hypothetical protein